jgi:hypothetical protein
MPIGFSAEPESLLDLPVEYDSYFNTNSELDPHKQDLFRVISLGAVSQCF